MLLCFGVPAWSLFSQVPEHLEFLRGVESSSEGIRLNASTANAFLKLKSAWPWKEFTCRKKQRLEDLSEISESHTVNKLTELIGRGKLSIATASEIAVSAVPCSSLTFQFACFLFVFWIWRYSGQVNEIQRYDIFKTLLPQQLRFKTMNFHIWLWRPSALWGQRAGVKQIVSVIFIGGFVDCGVLKSKHTQFEFHYRWVKPCLRILYRF